MVALVALSGASSIFRIYPCRPKEERKLTQTLVRTLNLAPRHLFKSGPRALYDGEARGKDNIPVRRRDGLSAFRPLRSEATRMLVSNTLDAAPGWPSSLHRVKKGDRRHDDAAEARAHTKGLDQVHARKLLARAAW